MSGYCSICDKWHRGKNVVCDDCVIDANPPKDDKQTELNLKGAKNEN